MRLKEFQSFIKQSKLDFVILLNHYDRVDPNFVYFTKIKNVLSFLVFPPDKGPFLIVSPLEFSIAKRYSEISKVYTLRVDFAGLIKSKVRVKHKRIGINEDYTTVHLFKDFKKNFRGFKFVDVSRKLSELRSIKTEKEIYNVRKACQFTDQIFKQTVKQAKSDKSEKDLTKFIEERIRKLGLKSAFNPIVAAGKNSANPHHPPSNTKLRGFVVIDIGVRYRDYCSDMTRTIYIGKPSDKELRDYEKVLKVQQDIINKLKVNMKTSTIDRLARKKIKFPHSLGHGIGLESHESPLIGPRSKDKISNNMTFTIEPGIYKKNKHGIRIEDVVLIKKGKAEVLTRSPKNLITIRK